MLIKDIKTNETYACRWGGFPEVEALETGVSRTTKTGTTYKDGVLCLVLRDAPEFPTGFTVGDKVVLRPDQIEDTLEQYNQRVAERHAADEEAARVNTAAHKDALDNGYLARLTSGRLGDKE